MIDSKMGWGLSCVALAASMAMAGACTQDVKVGEQKGAGGSASSSTSSSSSSSGATTTSSSSSSSTGSSSSGGATCTADADCGNGYVCGFPQADGCAATGQCFPSGPLCNAFSPGCSCAGNTINIVCGGLPDGYETAPLAHAGACVAPACSLGNDPLPCASPSDCTPYSAVCNEFTLTCACCWYKDPAGCSTDMDCLPHGVCKNGICGCN